MCLLLWSWRHIIFLLVDYLCQLVDHSHAFPSCFECMCSIVCVCTGAEVAVLCITKSGEVVNYQAFTNTKGVYTVAETMPESERWDACLARPISSFHTSCNHLNQANNGIKFSYNRPSGYFHAVKPFVYRHQYAPSYCWFKRAFIPLKFCKTCSNNWNMK